ncbi:MAG: hypothetical protein HON32_00370 [Francisellaceae bacterium]|jgi:hypothetical protein|nr:hypothetical protein [Francisellaceae bacterium]MBT6538741.1 hypothetical protein [Francisellaceae bacterium]
MIENKYYRRSLIFPVLIMAIFMLLIYAPSKMSTPPQYLALVSHTVYNNNNQPKIKLETKNGKLYAHINPKEKNQMDELHYYSSQDEKLIPLKYVEQLMPFKQEAFTQEIDFEKFNLKIISTDETAPDGYSCKTRKASLSGLGIIISKNKMSNLSLEKYWLQAPIPGYYSSFLGWVDKVEQL